MFITRKHLSRRTVLRGMGVSIALPLLDSMIPAQTALKNTAAAPSPRVGFVYAAFTGPSWINGLLATEGSGFEFQPILKPLEPFRDRVNIISGLGHKAADTTANSLR